MQSPPCSTSSSLTRRSHPTTPHPHLPSSLRARRFLTPPVGQTQRVHPARINSRGTPPALAASLPHTQQQGRPPPAPTTTPKNQEANKSRSREVEKSEIQEPNPLHTRTPHHPRSPLEQDPKHLCFWLRISPMRSRGRMCKKEGSPEDYSSGLPFWSLHSSPLRCGEHIDQVYEYWLISAEVRRTH